METRKKTFTAEIPKDRVLSIPIPSDLPHGLIDVEVEFSPHEEPRVVSLKESFPPGFIGMWEDRADLENSPDYVQKIRKDLWHRS